MEQPHGYYKELLNSLREGVYFVDRERRITYWNKAAELITGFNAADVVGCRCMDNILTHIDAEGISLCQSSCPLAGTILDGQPREADVFLHHKDGQRVPVSIRIVPILGGAGEISGAVELFSVNRPSAAILSRIEELEQLALLDPLTSLANRRYAVMNIETRLEELSRYGRPFGVLFADIDHFKRINDSYGHQTGDQVLKFVANTFKSNSRDFDLFARWGGEEFVGIICNVDAQRLLRIGERLRMLIENSYTVSDQTRIQVTISLGATLARPGESSEQLLKRADAQLYKSKHAGRNRISMEP